MIIGLTGRNGSGKGTVADVLIKRGFTYYSLSDVIRQELRNQGTEITREKMIVTGRRLRQEGGPAVLAERILAQLEAGRNYIIDSIRNPAEVRALKTRSDFLLLNVDADREIRFQRCTVRRRENDPTTLDEFIRLENAELHSVDEAGQQLIATEELADATVLNNGTLDDLIQNLNGALIRLGQPTVA